MSTERVDEQHNLSKEIIKIQGLEKTGKDTREDEIRDIKLEISGDNNSEREIEEVAVEVRSERFVETGNGQLLKSGNLNELNCFYQGDFVHERMAAVRHSIVYIRQNWSKFDQFLYNLKSFMRNEALKTGKPLTGSVESIFDRRRNWVDIEDTKEVFSSLEEEFNVIHTYTTQEGFKEIFKVSDAIFRKDSSVDYKDIATNAVFLIELINIDLYNFVHKYPQFSKFEGAVYRGMAIPPSAFTVFESLMKQPINKRYVSIPLGLWSASLERNKAIDFVVGETKNNPQNVPLLMIIHVLNLDETYLQFYRDKFQKKSIVSTIYAVPIFKISKYPEEAEVLLRGGFFQAINFYDKRIGNIDFKILELVMLNSNRDHLSTPTFMTEDENKLARTLFGTMVGVTRNRFIVNYCKGNNMLGDCEEYQKMLNEGEEKLKQLMKNN